ncbi:hypothetical protein SeMB42_g01578 [Synchytrium endobioticum]|uniref:non-specific serine/threonine protein kinase n=1 Tax=Synchytrium endobioticum TaxID=286115 RepID=A0A507DM13_9FUNG|nr:hypothetical protein SeLEV6574_g01463 [Synchytrium endobioticum]TPX52237.1 hypothetical protein SeMB42_g01578 [Synchytrium endobioticum]
MFGRRQLLGEYAVGKTIGQGAFSKVKLGIHRSTGQRVAIKIIDKAEMKKCADAASKDHQKASATPHKTPSTTSSEKAKSPRVNDTSTVPDRCESPKESSETVGGSSDALAHLEGEVLDTQDECFVVMEYASGGELVDLIAAKHHLSEKDARFYFRQLITAMDHCHRANVVHRDLKLENILLDGNKNILVSDFGLGRTFTDSLQLLNTFCGTPNYAAVELITGTPYVGSRSDIWAMGVILYAMLTGSPPFQGENVTALYSKIRHLNYSIPDNFSHEVRDLFKRIFCKNCNYRIDMDGLRAHPWVVLGEGGPPPRIEPILTHTGPSVLGHQILSITADEKITTYTCRQHVVAGVGVKPIPPGFDRRRSFVGMESASSNASKSGSRKPPADWTGSKRPSADFSSTTCGTRRASTRSGHDGSVSSQPSSDFLTLPGQHARPLEQSFSDDGGSGDSRREGTKHDEQSHSSGTPESSVKGSLPSLPENGSHLPDDTPSAMRTRRHTTVSSNSPIWAYPKDNAARSRRSSVIVDTRHDTAGSRDAAILVRMTQAGPDNAPFPQHDPPDPRSSLTQSEATAISPTSARPTVASRDSVPARRHSSVLNALHLLRRGPPSDTTAAAADDSDTIRRVAMEVDAPPRRLTPHGRHASETGPAPLITTQAAGPAMHALSSSATSPLCAGSSNRSSESPTTATEDVRPSWKEIQAWHKMHAVPASIRTARFFVAAQTTSTLSAAAIFLDVHRVLVSMQQMYTGRLSFKRDSSMYLLNVTITADDKSVQALELQVEICKVWLLKLHGVSLKRISGSAFMYKEVYNTFTSLLRI